MNTHADKTQEDKRQSAANEASHKQIGDESNFQFADNGPEAVSQRKLQGMVNNGTQVKQLKAFQELANNNFQTSKAAQLQVIADNDVAQNSSSTDKSGKYADLPIQRYPIALDELNDNNENPGVYTDSKHDWMRMIESNLGDTTFELLQLDGTPSGSLMIWESAYDQYRFSPDGRDFDDAMFPPHFMEEITGNDQIADDIEDPLYSYVGEYGVGYRPANGLLAKIELSGLISCIGFVLESENAGFACHMVVSGPPKNEGVLKGQVNALVAKFEQHAGERPEVCILLYDESTYQGCPEWLTWMEPNGVDTRMIPVSEDYRMNITGHMEDQPTVMWRGEPIRY